MWSAEETKNGKGKGGKYLGSQEYLGKKSSSAPNVPDCWRRKLFGLQRRRRIEKQNISENLPMCQKKRKIDRH